MAIKGSLKEASLGDVCQLLALGMKTGCLSITDRSRFGQIYFDRGRINFAHVVNRRDRLGDMMIRDGLVTPEALDAVLERQAHDPDKRVGELLVKSGLLTQADLARYVRQQIEEAFYHLCTWTRGSFFFEADERPQSADILVSINPESVLLEAARRVDEWSQIEQKVPSLDLLFEVERRVGSSDVDLTAEQQQIVPLLDGNRSVQDVIDESGLTDFEVGKALFGLVQAGFAHHVGRRPDKQAARSKEGEALERRNLGTAFFRTRMFDAAAREFERVLELEPNDLHARFHVGLIAAYQRRYRDAMRQFKMLLEEGGQRFAAFVNLAYALRGMGRSDDALLVLREAEALRPGTAVVALARAMNHLEAQDLAAAESAFDEYRSRLADGERSSELYHHYAALAQALRRDLDGALRVVEQGLEAYPTSAPLLLLAGLVHERRGDIDGADRWYRRALEEGGGLAQAHKNLGDVTYRRGEHEQALTHYRRAAGINPAIGDDTYAKIGNLLYKAKQQEAAVAQWQRALELNPDNEVVRKNLQIIAHAAG